MRRSNQEGVLTMRMSLLRRVTVASAIGVSLIFGVTSAGPLAQSRPKFFSDDPIVREPETQDASKAQSWTIGPIADLTLNVFGHPGDPILGTRAQNVNTIDEVPDSNWFVNRIY